MHVLVSLFPKRDNQSHLYTAVRELSSDHPPYEEIGEALATAIQEGVEYVKDRPFMEKAGGDWRDAIDVVLRFNPTPWEIEEALDRAAELRP